MQRAEEFWIFVWVATDCTDRLPYSSLYPVCAFRWNLKQQH